MRPLPTYREGRHGGGFLCFLLFLSVFLQILYVSLLQLSFQDLCRTDSQVLTGSLLIIIVCACLRHRSRITCDPRKQVPADDASIFLPELLRQLLDQHIMVCLWLPGLRPGPLTQPHTSRSRPRPPPKDEAIRAAVSFGIPISSAKASTTDWAQL